MAFIGVSPVTNFETTTAVQRFNGDGSDTTFTLTTAVSSAAENKGNFKAGGLFRTNAQNLTANTTILATENAQVTGTFTVDSGVTLTINDGGRLVVS
jgi:hypothetical protein